MVFHHGVHVFAKKASEQETKTKQPKGKDKRSYASEMELALDMAKTANHDKNPNREAEVNGWLNYGLAIALARRSHAPMPQRPEGRFV